MDWKECLEPDSKGRSKVRKKEQMRDPALLKILRSTTNRPFLSLLEKLKDKEWVIREDAAEQLGEFGEMAIYPLIDAFDDENLDVEDNIRSSLREIVCEDKEHYDHLISGLYHESLLIKIRIIDLLGDVIAPDTTERKAVIPLIELLNEKHEEDIRGVIVKALGNLRDKRATIPLLNLLNKEDWNYRHNVIDVIEALINIRDSRIKEPLRKQLEIETDRKVIMYLNIILERLEKENWFT
jgi:HEAT repeat protein